MKSGQMVYWMWLLVHWAFLRRKESSKYMQLLSIVALPNTFQNGVRGLLAVSPLQLMQLEWSMPVMVGVQSGSAVLRACH